MNIFWMFRVSTAIGKNQPQKVLDLCKTRLRNHPKDIIALDFAADYSYKAGDTASAKFFAKRSLAIRPDDFDLHSMMIRILDGEGDQEAVLEHARWILALEETNSDRGDRQIEKQMNGFWRHFIKKEWQNDLMCNLDSKRIYRAKFIAWAKARLKYAERNELD